MLHIVQVVMWGAAEMPQVFIDEAKARTAYVDCARKNWEQRYAAYCEHHNLSGDAFESARAFAGTIDPSEKSAIHYWTFDAREAGLGDAENPLVKEGLEEFRHLAGKVAAAKAEFTRLLDELSSLTDRFAGEEDSSVEGPPVDEPEKAAPPLSAPPRQEPEADPATRTAPEWKTLVGTVKRMGSGSANDFYLLPRDAWRQEVYSDRTSLEYWDWVADRITKLKERAKDARYTVAEVPDSPGCYRFVTPDGVSSEDCGDSEWEAWCAAGLDQEANCLDDAG